MCPLWSSTIAATDVLPCTRGIMQTDLCWELGQMGGQHHEELKTCWFLRV